MNRPGTEIHIDRIGPGGAAVGRIDGRVTFVPGLLPGERARVEIVEEKKRWARAELVELLEPATERVTPPCAHFGVCGGCSWQHAEPSRHAEWKRSIVEQQLRRIGKLDCAVEPTISPTPPDGYRNKVVFEVEGGRPAFHRVRSHDREVIDDCLLLRPELRELLPLLGDLTGVTRLTLRVGVRTGERLALVEGRVPKQAANWPCSVVHVEQGGWQTVQGCDHIHEEVAGARLRITADAFFQVNTVGAETLVELVRSGLRAGPEDTLVDLYAGGGLFSATVGSEAGQVTAVESAPSAAVDFKVNVDPRVKFERRPVEEWRGRADLVICDPPRRGLAAAGVATVLATDARSVAYVSCDPGTFARDAQALDAAGLKVKSVQPVDLFPHTAHVELVGLFSR